MGALLAGECGLKHLRHHAVPCCAVLLLQVPNLDAAVSTKQSIKQRGIGKSLRMLLAGLTDLARTAVGQEPIYLPLAGKNSTACHPSCLISSICCSSDTSCHSQHVQTSDGHMSQSPVFYCMVASGAFVWQG